MARKGEYIPKKNLLGMKFGKLTVIEYAGYEIKFNRVQHLWKCKCDCGNIKISQSRHLLNKHCQSCGCLPHIPKTLPNVKHHKSNTRLHNVWKSMKGRCYTKSCSGYENYGGRGITVCEEWRNDFSAFYEWSIANGYKEVEDHSKYTLDRIDVNGNYEPSNCRWVDMKVQCNNKRNNARYMFDGELLTLRDISQRTGANYKTLKGRIDRGEALFDALYGEYDLATYYLEYNGERHTIPEWSKITGIKEITIRARLKRGWSVEKTLSEPVQEKARDLWKCKRRNKNQNQN